MSSVWHIFDYTPLMFASNKLPFQDDCFQCRSIARRKKFLTKKCRQMSACKLPRDYIEHASGLWSFWKSVLSSLTWSAPVGFLLALDWIFYLPLRIVLPVVCSIQLSIFYLIQGVHGAFYFAGHSYFVPAPWLYPLLTADLIYMLRQLFYFLDIGHDPMINAHITFSQKLFGFLDSPAWKSTRIFTWIVTFIVHLLVGGWICYKVQESRKHRQKKIEKLLGDQAAFSENCNPAMSWRRQLKRAPTV